jgi:hypothetical protein
MPHRDDWEFFRTFADLDPAEAMRSWLEFEGVPCKIEARALENARESRFCVFVAKALAHRARWIVAHLPPTDEELEFLATGKLPGEQDK